MNKLTLKIAYLIVFSIFLLIGCSTEEPGRTVYPESMPEMSNIVYSFSNEVSAPDSIFISVDISDPLTPLSTLDVVLKNGDGVLYSESIRTKGRTAQIKKHGIFIPFYKNFEAGEATLILTAINVEGTESVEKKTFELIRPNLPNKLYLHYQGNVVEMVQSSSAPFEYMTAKGSFPDVFSGKISSSPTLIDSKLIWGSAEGVNNAEIINIDGADFSFRNELSTTDQVTFNTFTFEIGAIGISKIISVNGVELKANADLGGFEGKINFTENSEIAIAGIADLEKAYNRDFFSYDSATETCKFTGKTGTWDVFYSAKYNYFWISKMDEVAPNAYWMIGAGFVSMPRWHDDFTDGGWELDDIKRMAYMKRIDSNKYQATVFLSDKPQWGFDIQIYSNRTWEANFAVFANDRLTGDKVGFKAAGGKMADLVSDDSFVPGYFRITLDVSAGLATSSIHIERLN